MGKFKPEIKYLVQLHTIMLVIVIVFTALAYIFSNKFYTNVVSDSVNEIVQIIAVLLAIILPTIAFVSHHKKRKLWQQSQASFDQKITDYKASCIRKFTLLEAPIVFAAIGYFRTQNVAFILLSLVLIFVFAGQKPTVALMTYDMNIDKETLFDR
ncbi:MAG: hypothetical protein ACOVNY_12495 [Chitinophagaceae bacterium]